MASTFERPSDLLERGPGYSLAERLTVMLPRRAILGHSFNVLAFLTLSVFKI